MGRVMDQLRVVRCADGMFVLPGAGISNNQFKSHVSLQVITNNVCRNTYPANVLDSTLCTSGAGGVGTCGGDSGGPLTVTSANQNVLVSTYIIYSHTYYILYLRIGVTL